MTGYTLGLLDWPLLKVMSRHTLHVSLCLSVNRGNNLIYFKQLHLCLCAQSVLHPVDVTGKLFCSSHFVCLLSVIERWLFDSSTDPLEEISFLACPSFKGQAHTFSKSVLKQYNIETVIGRCSCSFCKVLSVLIILIQPSFCRKMRSKVQL